MLAFVLSLVDGSVDMLQRSWIDLGGIYFLALLLPRLAVKVRRLHDSNRSGWWVLLLYIPVPVLFIGSVLYFLEIEENTGVHIWEGFFPLTLVLWGVGAIWFYVLMFWRGTVGTNRFGLDPKGPARSKRSGRTSPERGPRPVAERWVDLAGTRRVGCRADPRPASRTHRSP